MPITPGQTYRAADPRDSIRIRIKSYTPGENRALVVDATTGKRPRPMLVTALHESSTTQAGKPRRSGYVLEQPDAGIRDAARTASGQQPETCRPIDVDGTTVLVRGSGDWTDEDQHHMAAIVAAAKRRYEAEHPACSCTHPQDRHLSACTECPCIGYAPTWPPTKRRIVPVCDQCGAPWATSHRCATAPAVGQPAEAQATDEARPPQSRWRVEGYDADEWNPVSRTFSSSQDAHARKRVSQRYPDMPTRVVRETTTWTVEDETR